MNGGGDIPLLTMIVDGISWFALVSGALLCVIGGIGLLRLPDLYSRSHAASLTDTLGALLIFGGLTLQAGPTLIAAKLVMLVVLLLITTPLAAHALMRAAFARGLPMQIEPPADDDASQETGT
ncbi:MAG: monovalent cation/H(+) antiporter subunit G [Acidobacteriota bacterium]